MARAAAESAPIWLEAKMTSNFELFLPALERAVELRRRYIACFDPTDEPYDILLDDFEPETKSADVTRIFAEIKAELVPLIAELRRARGRRLVPDRGLPGRASRSRSARRSSTSSATGPTRGASTRRSIRSPPAPASTTSGSRRTTTRDTLESLFSTMHEYGHGLYQHQIRRDIAHLPIGSSSSLGIHESQSRLWENLVGRGMPFWRFFYPRLQELLPRAARRGRAGRVLRRDQQGAAVADPHPRGRGHVRDARDPPLRARAGHRQRPRRARATCRGSGTSGWTTTSGSRCRTTRTACSRTCTGRRG